MLHLYAVSMEMPPSARFMAEGLLGGVTHLSSASPVSVPGGADRAEEEEEESRVERF